MDCCFDNRTSLGHLHCYCLDHNWRIDHNNMGLLGQHITRDRKCYQQSCELICRLHFRGTDFRAKKDRMDNQVQRLAANECVCKECKSDQKLANGFKECDFVVLCW